jgi:hypothetical protein
MKIGKLIDRSHEASVVPPDMPISRKKKLKYAFWAAVPVAVAVGAALKTTKSRRLKNEPTNVDPGKPRDGGPAPP